MKVKIQKELIEWIIILVVISLIYFGGWHTMIIGKVQQMVLSTGVITPSIKESGADAAYNFTLEDTKGNKIAFEDFSNQPVFVNFWATWCPPCIAEMPDIHTLFQKQKDQVRFIMISVDKDEQKAIEFIQEQGFDFPVYFLRSPLPNVYNIQSIPTTYVIDKEGMIRVENHGMAKYNTKDFITLLNEISR